MKKIHFSLMKRGKWFATDEHPWITRFVEPPWNRYGDMKIFPRYEKKGVYFSRGFWATKFSSGSSWKFWNFGHMVGWNKFIKFIQLLLYLLKLIISAWVNRTASRHADLLWTNIGASGCRVEFRCYCHKAGSFKFNFKM